MQNLHSRLDVTLFGNHGLDHTPRAIDKHPVGSCFPKLKIPQQHDLGTLLQCQLLGRQAVPEKLVALQDMFTASLLRMTGPSSRGSGKQFQIQRKHLVQFKQET